MPSYLACVMHCALLFSISIDATILNSLLGIDKPTGQFTFHSAVVVGVVVVIIVMLFFLFWMISCVDIELFRSLEIF